MADLMGNPSDFEQQQLDLMQRKGRYAQQQQINMPGPGQMVGNRFVATNPLNYLAEMLRGYGAQRGEENVTAELKDLQGKRSEAMASALRNFTDKATGAPAFEAAGPAQQGPQTADPLGLDGGKAAPSGGYQVPAQKPDLQGAYTGLLNAPDASLRQMGIKGLMDQAQINSERARQQQQSQLWEASGGDVNKFRASGGDLKLAKDFAESGNWGKTKGIAVNGQIVDPITGKKIGEAIPHQANPASDLLIPDGKGGLMVNTQLVGAKKEIQKAGATNVSVNSDKSYFGEVAQGLAKQDVGTIDAARNAPKAIETARSIKTLLSDPSLITGTGANARLGLNKAFQTAGLIDGKTVANTEQLGSLLASQTLDAVKSSGLGAGNGFTNADREFLEKAKSGQLSMDVNTLRRIADMNEKTGLATIEKGNSVIKNLRGSGKMGNVSLQEVQAPVMQGFRIIRD